jgi:tRNA threonylcarbamoyl adenosine modification protein YjeE
VSDAAELRLESASPAETRSIGQRLGRALRPGDVIVLEGDLGAGKTTFTQGIAVGMGIDEAITSPTFVLAREMPAGTTGVALTHVDAYRLTSLEEWDDLDIDFANTAVVIEWGARVQRALPGDRVAVRLEGDDASRTLYVTRHGSDPSGLLLALEGDGG